MNRSKLVAAAFLALAVAAVPRTSDARIHHHRYHGYYSHRYGLPYPISYLHNYGPGPVSGSFAYYDGPASNLCYQSAAAYVGQDRRLHPCF
ncbi:MAG: hypothetical protein JOY90_05735 [Bradyrhizobium sp.]|uniref:hypothetical protein n=1 Tax=Bradyrhizobium sp. TaxID=376 RepID=UPI001DFE149C|nr:hypothetical protein [Bradyrhizobium sp.]MBV9559950.1 hypothetical protein [Bradyrhizobium sp.]